MGDQKAARKGIHTFYENKQRDAVTINLTTESHGEIDRLKPVVKASRADILEHSFRKMVGLKVNQELDAALSAAK